MEDNQEESQYLCYRVFGTEDYSYFKKSTPVSRIIKVQEFLDCYWNGCEQAKSLSVQLQLVTIQAVQSKDVTMRYRETDINIDYRGYYLASILIEHDGPAYYLNVQADTERGIKDMIDAELNSTVNEPF